MQNVSTLEMLIGKLSNMYIYTKCQCRMYISTLKMLIGRPILSKKKQQHLNMRNKKMRHQFVKWSPLFSKLSNMYIQNVNAECT